MSFYTSIYWFCQMLICLQGAFLKTARESISTIMAVTPDGSGTGIRSNDKMRKRKKKSHWSSQFLKNYFLKTFHLLHFCEECLIFEAQNKCQRVRVTGVTLIQKTVRRRVHFDGNNHFPLLKPAFIWKRSVTTLRN